MEFLLERTVENSIVTISKQFYSLLSLEEFSSGIFEGNSGYILFPYNYSHEKCNSMENEFRIRSHRPSKILCTWGDFQRLLQKGKKKECVAAFKALRSFDLFNWTPISVSFLTRLHIANHLGVIFIS